METNQKMNNMNMIDLRRYLIGLNMIADGDTTIQVSGKNGVFHLLNVFTYQSDGNKDTLTLYIGDDIEGFGEESE